MRLRLLSFPAAAVALALALPVLRAADPLPTARVPVFNFLSSGGTVRALLPLPDSRMLVSREAATTMTNASFSAPLNTPLVFVNADGSLTGLGTDPVTGFTRPTIAGGSILTLLRQPDGKFIVGGGFTALNGIAVNRLARLHPDGSLDLTFNPGTAVTVAGEEVRSLALDTAGRLLVGGNFTAFAGSTKNYLVRLAADGALDAAFTATANGNIGKLVALPDGGFLAAGSHPGGSPVNRIARYSAAGAVTYLAAPSSNGNINDLALTPAGEAFYVASLTAPFLSRRLLADGAPDATFAPGGAALDNPVQSLAVQPDGKLIVFGGFTSPYNRVARYLADGTLDPLFKPGTGFGFNDTPYALALDQAGRIWFGGTFTQFNSGTSNARILALEGDVPALAWSRQPAALSLTARATATFTVAARTPEGTTVSYQWFKNGAPLAASSRQLGVTGPALTLLGVTVADEGLYTATATTANAGPITSTAGELTFLGSPEILVAPVGALREIALSSTLTVAARGAGVLAYQWFRGTATSPAVAISGANGPAYTLANPATTDTAYYSVQVTNTLGSITSTPVLVTYQRFAGGQNAGLHPTFNLPVNALLQLPTGGGTLVGGDFTQAYPANGVGFVNRNYFARITPEGALDAAWPATNGNLNVITRDASGRILIGGVFNTVGASASPKLARLSTAGVVDATFVSPFNTGAASNINAIAFDASGRIYVGGSSSNIPGQSKTFYLMRLSADGAFDAAFSLAAEINIFQVVNAIHVLADGKILVGYNGGRRRLNADGTIDHSYNSSTNAIAVGAIYPIPGTAEFLYAGTTSGLQRLTADGAVVYNKTSTGALRTLLGQPDGRVFVGGGFSAYDGVTTPGFLRRLDPADGSLDATFDPGAGFNSTVRALATDDQGRLVVGGNFGTYKGVKVSLSANNPNLAGLAVLGTTAELPPDPGAPAPDAFTQFLIDAGVAPAQHGTGDDPDGDGSTNAEEFAHGTNPALATDTKFTLVQTGAGFVRYPDRTNVASTGTSGTGLAYTLPADTSLLVGPDSFGNNPSLPTFRGWAPTDYDPALGYLASVSTTPLPVTLNANRRLRAIMGYPLDTPLPGFTWTTGGNHLWSGTADVFAPAGGLMTARATALEAPTEETWLETTVTAPGVLRLNWRLDATTGTLSRLNLTANGVELAALESFPTNFSSTGFVPAAYSLPGSGPVTLRFRLVRLATSPNNAFPAAGQETAYLANFVFGALAAPVLAAPSAITDTSLTLNWAASAGAASYLVEIAADAGFTTGLQTFSTAGTTLTQAVRNLAHSTTYHYRVTAQGPVAANGPVTVSTASGTATVGTLILTTPEITAVPAALTRDLGGVATFTATARGAGTLAYQWFRGATALVNGTVGGVTTAGATGAALTLTGTSFADAGDYTLRVTNHLGELTSAPVTLTVQRRPGGLAAGVTAPSFNGEVYALLILADGSTLVGGAFTSVTINGVTTSRSRFVHILADGTLDPAFVPAMSGAVRALARDADGRVFVGGDFTSFSLNGVGSRNRIARLTSALEMDPAFDTSTVTPNNTVFSLAPVGDGSVYIGGTFTALGSVNSSAVARMALLAADGTLDIAFTSGASSIGTASVNAILRLPDGTLYAGGSSNTWSSIALPNSNPGRLVKLTAAGVRDANFASPATTVTVNALALTATGDLYVGGLNSSPQNYLARHDPATGAVLTTTPAGHSSQVNALALQTDGQLLSAALGTLQRTSADGGTLDATFSLGTGFNAGRIYALGLDAAGRIYAAGAFTTLNGVTVNRFVILNGGELETRPLVRTPQTVAFNTIADRTFDPAANTLALSATASSGLAPVTFTVTSGPATVAGDLLTITGAGSVFVTAAQAGDATFAAATASRSFTVAPAAQTITFAPLADLPADAPAFDLAATTTAPGLAVQFAVTGPATLGANNRTLTLTGIAGTVTVTATQSGNTNYADAPAVVRTFTVTAVASDPFADYLASAGVPPAQRGPNADPDADGLANLLEYALGLAPMTADPVGAPVAAVVGGNLTFTYVRVRAELTYLVETTTDLANAASWTATGVTQGAPDGNGTVTASVAMDVPNRFLRLKVTRP